LFVGDYESLWDRAIECFEGVNYPEREKTESTDKYYC